MPYLCCLNLRYTFLERGRNDLWVCVTTPSLQAKTLSWLDRLLCESGYVVLDTFASPRLKIVGTKHPANRSCVSLT